MLGGRFPPGGFQPLCELLGTDPAVFQLSLHIRAAQALPEMLQQLHIRECQACDLTIVGNPILPGSVTIPVGVQPAGRCLEKFQGAEFSRGRRRF